MNGKGILALFSLVALGAIGAFVYIRLQPPTVDSAKLEKQLANAKSMGILTSESELKAKYPKAATWTPLPASIMGPPTLLEQRFLGKSASEVVRLFNAASANLKPMETQIKNADRFDVDLSGFGENGTAYIDAKAFVKIHSDVATAYAQLGQTDKALQHLKLADKATIMCFRSPRMISILVGIAMHAIKSKALSEMLEARPEDKEFIKALQQSQSEVELGDLVAVAVRAEAFESLDLLRNLQKYGGVDKLLQYAEASMYSDKKVISRAVTHTHEGLPSTPEGKLAWSKVLERSIGFLDKLNSKATVAEIANQIQNEVEAEAKSSDKVTQLYSINATYLPDTVSAAGQAQDQALVFQAVSEFLLTVPSSQRAAKAKAFFAKYTCGLHGKPLQCQWSGRTLKVWSVGRDGKDDGGNGAVMRDIVIKLDRV